MAEAIGEYMAAMLERAKTGRKLKTQTWLVWSRKSGARLGTVKWFGRWRQYAFEPWRETTFNAECLRDMVGFLAKVNEEHRQSKQRGN